MTTLTGKTALITGATNGIGLEASVALARLGARVILVGRDEQRTSEAGRAVQARSGSSAVDLELCDLSSLEQVRRLAERVRTRYPRLEVLVNNAGGAFLTRTVTPEGFEASFAVNHLAPYLLTRLLAGQCPLHARARPAARGLRDDDELPPSGPGRHRHLEHRLPPLDGAGARPGREPGGG